MILPGGNELVGDGDFVGGRGIEPGFKLCVGLLLEGGAGGPPRTLTLVGPLARFPKFGGPGGGSFLKLGLLLPEGGVGRARLLVGGALFCDGILKPIQTALCTTRVNVNIHTCTCTCMYMSTYIHVLVRPMQIVAQLCMCFSSQF